VFVAPLFAGENSADIGRIASKHVKVTVSHKNIQGRNKDRPVTSPRHSSSEPASNNDAMNHVYDVQNPKETKQAHGDIEDVDIQDGMTSLFRCMAPILENPLSNCHW